PTNSNLVYNPGFDADSRGRIGMWSEETAGLIAGSRGGSLAGIPNGHTGPGLQLVPQSDKWFGVRVVPANVVPGIASYRLSGWTKSEGGKAVIGAVWLDRDEKIIRTDLSPPASTINEWQLQSITVAAPPGAVQLAAVAVASNGRADFDDFAIYPS